MDVCSLFGFQAELCRQIASVLDQGHLSLTLVKKYILTIQLCLFARAAKTELHNQSDLEQQKYIVFGLWRLEV